MQPGVLYIKIFKQKTLAKSYITIRFYDEESNIHFAVYQMSNTETQIKLIATAQCVNEIFFNINDNDDDFIIYHLKDNLPSKTFELYVPGFDPGNLNKNSVFNLI